MYINGRVSKVRDRTAVQYVSPRRDIMRAQMDAVMASAADWQKQYTCI